MQITHPTTKTKAMLAFGSLFGIINAAVTVSIAFILQRAVDAAARRTFVSW